MTFRKLAVTAGLALAAEAFMIPSTISLPGVEVDGDSDFHALRMPARLPEQLKHLQFGVSKPTHEDTGVTHVELDCPGCSFRPEDGDAEAHAAAKNNLVSRSQHVPPTSIAVNKAQILDFAISDSRKTLDLNGAALYPFAYKADGLTAQQSARDTKDEILSPPRPLEYSVGVRRVEAADDTDAELIDLFLSIHALGDENVNVNGIDIRMLSDETGNLHLVHLITSPNEGPQNGRTQDKEVHNPPAPVAGACPDHGLAAMMCRLRASVIQKAHDWQLVQPNPHRKIHGMKRPCNGKMRHLQGQNGVKTHGGLPKFGVVASDRPDPILHGQRPHAHSLLHRAASFLRAFVLGFVVPVLVGIVAGMTASLLGMIVGTLIAWVWVKLVRGGKRGNASVRQEERAALVEEEDVEDGYGEKDGLLDHAPDFSGESPPVYVEKE